MAQIRILIIEDDLEALAMYTLMLERWGYQVIPEIGRAHV